VATRIARFGPTDGIASIPQVRPSEDVVADGFSCREADVAGPDHVLSSDGGLRAPVADLFPIGSLLIIVTAGLIAFGEPCTPPRMYEHPGALAPNQQEELFLGALVVGVLAASRRAARGGH
jgi:hypothetical protein